MRKKITILMTVLLVLGWYQTVNTVFGTTVQYENHINAAEKYAGKEIYEDALTEYEAALALRPDSADAKRKIAEMQLKLENKSEFIAGCEALIYQEKPDEEALRMLVSYYDIDGKQEDIVAMLKELRSTQSGNETVAELWNQYRGSYEELYYSYGEMQPFYFGYAVAGNEGRYGLIDTEGKNVITFQYDAVGYFSKENGCAPVNEGGRWYYLNTKEHKKIVPDEPYEFLGVISEGTAVVGKNGKYGFVDTQMTQKTECIWDAASNLCEGIAAVQKDEKWALLDADFQLLTDYIYEGVAIDEAGFCSEGGRVFVKESDGYHLLDEKGTEITGQVFEDARPFGDEGLAPVCINGAWGFVNTQGELVLSASYEDARDFHKGVAPVQKDGKWGYIDTKGDLLIEPVFEDAYPFNDAGTAPVKKESWFLIRLYAIS